MFRKGYLDSQIEELGRTMAKILSAMIGRKFEEAEPIAAEALAASGIRLDELLGLDERELLVLLSAMPVFNGDNLEALADVFAALAEKTGGDAQLYRKSLALYEFVNTSGRVFSLERHAKIARVKSRL